MTASAGARPSILKPFTAVDFVTIAVFAAIYRSTWYLFTALSAVFPFNEILNNFFSLVCMITAMLIVRKLGTATLWAIVAQLINFFLQGELLPIVFLYFSWGIIADAWIWYRLRKGADPFSSLRDMMIAGVLTAALRTAEDWGLVVPIMLQMQMDRTVLMALIPTHFAGGVIGAWSGWYLGERLRGLIH